MSELTHEPAEDGFHEIQLSGKQLVFLFMATSVVLVVIFLCGVLVGRDVRAGRDAEQPIDSAVATEPRSDLPPPAVEPPPASTEAAPATDPLTYHRELQQSGAPAELKKPSEPAAPAPRPEAEPAAAPPPAAAEPAAANVPTSGRAGTWFLQVMALKNRAAAARTVQSLIAKGYPAFLENPAAGTPVTYRVRIGRFKDRAEAEQAARRLQKEEQLTSDIRR